MLQAARAPAYFAMLAKRPMSLLKNFLLSQVKYDTHPSSVRHQSRLQCSLSSLDKINLMSSTLFSTTSNVLMYHFLCQTTREQKIDQGEAHAPRTKHERINSGRGRFYATVEAASSKSMKKGTASSTKSRRQTKWNLQPPSPLRFETAGADPITRENHAHVFAQHVSTWKTSGSASIVNSW